MRRSGHNNPKSSFQKIKDFFSRKTSLTIYSFILSLFTLIAYHYPFFRSVVSNTEGGA